MGAQVFYTTAEGKSAREAFATARSRAQYDHGHGGYTGTIAEKDSFTVIPAPVADLPPDVAAVVAENLASALIDAADERVDDKFGPAGCIEYLPSKFLFFGWASS